jgi:hypothetical protein
MQRPRLTPDYGSPGITDFRVAQVLAGRDAIPDNLLQLLDLGETSFFRPRPDGIIADMILENASSVGINAISPISVEKVVRSSCCD